jgi:hypothetical protein
MRDWWTRIFRHPVFRILIVFAVSRAIQLGVLLGVSVTTRVFAQPVQGGIANLLCRFDCEWYVRVATEGPGALSRTEAYATGYAFFPLYPSTVAIVSQLTGLPPLTAGFVLSNVFFVAALTYIYYYVRDLGWRHRTGMLAVTLLCFAPPTIVFSSAFSESMFMLLLAAAVFHIRRGEFGRSAVAAALLSATRPNGVAFVVFALIYVARHYGLRAFLRPWQRPEVFLPIVFAPLGIFAYWTYSFVNVGDAFAHVSANVHGWNWGMTGAIEQLTMLTRLDLSDQLLIGVSAVALAISFLLLRYGLWEEFGLCVVTLAIFWTGGLAPWSMPRFALALFPLAVGVARLLETRRTGAAVAVAAAATINGFVLVVMWGLEAYVV